MAAQKRSTNPHVDKSAVSMSCSTAADLEDLITRRLNQVAGICALASLVGSSTEEIPDAALPNAMWAARDLLSEAEQLVGRLAGRSPRT